MPSMREWESRCIARGSPAPRPERPVPVAVRSRGIRESPRRCAGPRRLPVACGSATAFVVLVAVVTRAPGLARFGAVPAAGVARLLRVAEGGRGGERGAREGEHRLVGGRFARFHVLIFPSPLGRWWLAFRADGGASGGGAVAEHAR